MTVTAELAALLKTDEATADTVRDMMGENGLNFSQCTQREFNRAAREAFDTLTAVRADMQREASIAVSAS